MVFQVKSLVCTGIAFSCKSIPQPDVFPTLASVETYPVSEDWSVGTVVGYEYNKSGDVKTNTFTIAPYARYFFLNSDVVRLFADGGFGFSTSKTKGNDALNSWNIGIKPGIAIKLSDHFCLVAKYGFLGYSKKENHGYESENVGIDFDTDELNFGFHYIF